MKETEFHAWLRETIPPHPGVLLGIGDDAAVVDAAGPIAVASDLLVEGVHYIADQVRAREIGAKAVNRNFSDMAAMGLVPHWITASAAIPESRSAEFIHELVLGMKEAADRFGAALVGGDTARSPGPLIIDVTVLAKLGVLKPVTRSTAKPGDRILVTGELGGSSLGKHLHFLPRVKEGVFLNRLYEPTSMIDVSDGLALDLSRILDASGTGACLWCDPIPVAEAAHELARSSGREPLDHALGDGEDFELLFTLPPDRVQRLHEDPARSFQVTEIGEILADPDARKMVRQGKEVPLGREGYDHRI